MEEAKLPIKLIAVNSNHFMRRKCNTTSRLSNITRLSNIIWIYITIDDNEKLWINEVLEVLIGVGTFSSTSSFDTQCLLFFTMSEFKKSMPGGLQFFLFHLVVSYSVCFLLEFEATCGCDFRHNLKTSLFSCYQLLSREFLFTRKALAKKPSWLKSLTLAQDAFMFF